MSAEVAVVIEHHEEELSVPLSAVVYREEKRYVYRVDGENLHPVEVFLGSRNSSAVLVDSGLSEGDQISLAPPQ